MTYVEWLRVRNALRIFGIVLATIIILGGVARLSFAGFESSLDSTATVPAPMILRNGDTTTVLDPNKNLRIVFHTSKNGIAWQKAVPLTGADLRTLHAGPRTPITGEKYATLRVADVRLKSIEDVTLRPKGSRHARKHSPTSDFLGLLSTAAWVTLIFGFVLGSALARENDEHLEVAWTKPIDRTGLAIRTFGVDIVGILVALAMCFTTATVLAAMWSSLNFSIAIVQLPKIAVLILAPMAWYALLACGTASIRGRGAMVNGIAFALGFIVPPLAYLPIGGSALGVVVLSIIRFIALIDPLKYLSTGRGDLAIGATPGSLPGPDVLILVALVILYLAGAIVQWRRVEA